MRSSDGSSDVCSADLHPRLDRLAAQQVDQRVGGAVVADRDHPVGEALERHRRIPGPVGGARRREALIVQWDDIGPAALAGGDLRRQLVEDIELEDRADRELRVGMRSEEHTSELQSLMRITYAVCCLK